MLAILMLLAKVSMTYALDHNLSLHFNAYNGCT